MAAADSGRAADMPVKAVAAPVPVQTWTGCYFGAQVGAAQSNANWHYNGHNPYNAILAPGVTSGPTIVADESFSQWKAMIGGQVGCNYTLNGPWVVGIEGAWVGKAMNVTRDNNYPQFTGFANLLTTEISSIASFTGRLGYAVSPDWLIYAKGGVAFAKIETAGEVTPAAFDFLDWNDFALAHRLDRRRRRRVPAVPQRHGRRGIQLLSLRRQGSRWRTWRRRAGGEFCQCQR